MNQIVRYDRFGAREMIEQENLPLFDVAIGVVQLDIDPKTLFDSGQGPDRPRAGRLVYFQRLSNIGKIIFTHVFRPNWHRLCLDYSCARKG